MKNPESLYFSCEIDVLVDEKTKEFNLADRPSNPRKRRISSVTSSGWICDLLMVVAS